MTESVKQKPACIKLDWPWTITVRHRNKSDGIDIANLRSALLASATSVCFDMQSMSCREVVERADGFETRVPGKMGERYPLCNNDSDSAIM